MKKEFVIYEIEQKDFIVNFSGSGIEWESRNVLTEWSRHDTLQQAEERLETLYFERAKHTGTVNELIILIVYSV